MDPSVRRHLLRPLARRRRQLKEQTAVVAAMLALEERAAGEAVLPELAARPVPKTDKRGRWVDPEAVQHQVTLSRALYLARRISTQQYVIYTALPIEHLEDERLWNGTYASSLDVIMDKMAAMRADHGLQDDEFWPPKAAPIEFQELDAEWNQITDQNFARALREFGADDLARLYEEDRDEFERLRERGRRSVFHHREFKHALTDIVLVYEEDARRAAAAGAYAAAVTLLGAGCEGLLLLRCLRSKAKAARVASKLPRSKRPRDADPVTWTFDTLIAVSESAGWLPPVESSTLRVNPAGLAQLLRQMRNYIHPGRHVRERPWVVADEREYRDAEGIYVILLSALR